MKIKTTLAAMVLVALPGMAMAMGCNSMRATTASACGEGLVWDAGTETCIIPATS